MILNILKGKDGRSQDRLDQLSLALGENPSLSWYPSAGNDYRDLMEFTTQRGQVNGLVAFPDLLIHTDYMPTWVTQQNPLYDDGRTKVEMDGIFELELTVDIDYHVSSAHVVFKNDASPVPLIYLMDVTLTSETLGTTKKPVLYFLFENINFLDQILLKHKIRISHLVKVREGCGFGGNRTSISFVYYLLSALQTQFLLVDNRLDGVLYLGQILKRKYNLFPLHYTPKQLSAIPSWSGMHVKVFEIIYSDHPMDLDFMIQINGIIKNSHE
jgi:hypothetical protein